MKVSNNRAQVIRSTVVNEPTPPLMRVRDWDRLYENNRSREMKRTNWFPAPNDLSADGYVELVGHEQGAAHFGVWNAVLMVASRAKPRRGLLVRDDGRPHAAESLARVTRLPEPVVSDALNRLLQIGLLEIVGEDSRGISKLPPHPSAVDPQDPAGRPQESAVEGKGTEHHHQEGNRKEKKRTERAGDESTTERSETARDVGPLQRRPDDEENPGEVYASPGDELKAIYLEKAGEPITVAVLDAIWADLELNRVSMGEFVSVVKKHLPGKWDNPPAFLRYLARGFRAKTQPASEPITAAEGAVKNYQCPLCASLVPGEGAVFVNGKLVPCQCASPAYIAHERERGLFAEETSQ